MGNKKYERAYIEFAMWTALPHSKREPSTQKELTEVLKVTEKTLSTWKRRDDFWDIVRGFIKEWAKDSTAEIIQAIKEGALMVGEKGQAANAKLWLQYIEDWAEKQDISLYNAEKEKRATSLLDVYKEYGKTTKAKSTKRRTRTSSRNTKRSTTAKAGKANSKAGSQKRSNKRNSK